MTIQVEHFTSQKDFIFSPIKFKNGSSNKPIGGFWTSPITSNFGWKHWCEVERFDINPYRVELTISTDNLILIEDEYDLMSKLKYGYSNNKYNFKYVDYEKMYKSGVDAIWLTEYAVYDTRYTYNGNSLGMYGWDCETILILNERCIINYE